MRHAIRWTRRRGAHTLFGLTLTATLSCGDATGPSGPAGRIELDRAVSGTVSGDSVATWSFLAAPAGEYAITVRALQGGVELSLLDSVTRQQVNLLWADAVQQPTMNTVTWRADGGVLELRVRTMPPGSGPARFELRVSERSLQPEIRAAVFAVGDTVSGETMASPSDVDMFVVEGTPGEEIVAVAEPLPGATGILSLQVWEVPARTRLPLSYYAGGGPAHSATTRMTIPISGRLWFRFQSESDLPAYDGGYRFWTYAPPRTPEHRPSALPLSSVVAGESIDRSGDVDEFTFQAAAGSEYSAFLSASRTFSLEVVPQGGWPLTTVYNTQPSDTSLFAAGTGRFQVTQPGTWLARVTGSQELADTGAYRLYLFQVDRRPEHAVQALVVGDTVEGEAIELPGDMDEFTFTANAGEAFNAFLLATDTVATDRLELAVIGADSSQLGRTYSNEGDSALLEQPVGRFTVGRTGTQRVWVTGQALGGFAHASGRYRLSVQRIASAPETAPTTLGPADTVVSEAIDVPGDLDDFQVAVPDSVRLVLGVEMPAAAAGDGSIEVQLRDDGATLQQVDVYSPGRVTSGGSVLPPGTYSLRVGTGYYLDPKATRRGPYRLFLFRSSEAPETTGRVVSIGDTVGTERIDRTGDVDVFTFHGQRGQHVNIMLQGLSVPAGAWFDAFVTGPSGFPVVDVTAPQSSALAEHQSARLDLPATGWYRMRVGANLPADPFVATGAYRFAVLPADTAPEHVASTLVPGDSVTAEVVDAAGDLDAYDVSAAPASTLRLILGSPATDSRSPSAFAYDVAADSVLESVPGIGTQISAPFTVPAGGRVRIEVAEVRSGGFRACSDATCGDYYTYVGPYQMTVMAVNRGPESVAAAFAVGDTVRGEAVLPSGDIDELTTTGNPGDTLTAWFRILAAPQPAGTMVKMEVVDPATGAVLLGNAAATDVTPDFIRIGAFTVPAAGVVLVRFRGGLFAYDLGTAPYEFFVKRGT